MAVLADGDVVVTAVHDVCADPGVALLCADAACCGAQRLRHARLPHRDYQHGHGHRRAVHHRKSLLLLI